jgi:type IV secretion system protein VirB10
VAGERGISPVGAAQSRTGRAIAVAALAAGGLMLVLTNWNGHKKAPPPPLQVARQTVPFEPVKPPKSVPGAPMPAAGSDAAAGEAAAPLIGLDGRPVVPGGGAVVPALADETSGNGPSPAPPGAAGQPLTAAARAKALLESAQRAPLTAFAGASATLGRAEGALSAAVTALPGGLAAGAAGSGLNEAAGAPSGGGTELDRLRRGSSIGMASAVRLPDRSTLILAGTTLPCLLQTAMDTATPGYVACVIPKDVYSDNGAVILMEKGTKVLGEYASAMRQGTGRLFVLWTRAVTPQGIAITLSSPAADALGRGGFDGALDTQFWTRFGGALLFSIVDDASAIASQKASGGEFTNTTNLPSQAAAIALQNSINIPPVLRKTQGSEVSIMVAEDLSFARVYGLKARLPPSDSAASGGAP